jgi:hypothetical protein
MNKFKNMSTYKKTSYKHCLNTFQDILGAQSRMQGKYITTFLYTTECKGNILQHVTLGRFSTKSLKYLVI